MEKEYGEKDYFHNQNSKWMQKVQIKVSFSFTDAFGGSSAKIDGYVLPVSDIFWYLACTELYFSSASSEDEARKPAQFRKRRYLQAGKDYDVRQVGKQPTDFVFYVVSKKARKLTISTPWNQVKRSRATLLCQQTKSSNFCELILIQFSQLRRLRLLSLRRNHNLLLFPLRHLPVECERCAAGETDRGFPGVFQCHRLLFLIDTIHFWWKPSWNRGGFKDDFIILLIAVRLPYDLYDRRRCIEWRVRHLTVQARLPSEVRSLSLHYVIQTLLCKRPSFSAMSSIYRSCIWSFLHHSSDRKQTRSNLALRSSLPYSRSTSASMERTVCRLTSLMVGL